MHCENFTCVIFLWNSAMYQLIGNVLCAQKVFLAHMSVLRRWNPNVDKTHHLDVVAK